ncbi:MAG: hypothetical protein US69_C0002G0011 [candidate division TM6 bacterium GW2011_GWF2_38_10]|nr:MAG: hypothetical protein US69_C0002G0011 [candidate division TM6 bacterium GW2011_GWF2_38_10]
MEYLKPIISFVEGLNKKQFQNYLLLFLASVALVIGGIMYFVYVTSANLITEIKKIETLSQKTIKILANDEKMVFEERRLKELFDQNKDFSLSSFFESFCKEHAVTPEGDWAPRVVTSTDRFDEHAISTTFKDLTTEKLVQLLIELEKKEIIYIKDLIIKQDREKDKKIIIDIVIATKIMKKGFDQKNL